MQTVANPFTVDSFYRQLCRRLVTEGEGKPVHKARKRVLAGASDWPEDPGSRPLLREDS